MTEKRFTYTEQFNGFCDVYDNGKVLSCMRLEYIQNTVNLLNEQEETIQKQNQEITACYDTLATIHELCDAVLNHDFEGIVSKVDFCNMLIEMDNKDLMFLKECFEAIKDNDLKRMTSLTVECKYGGDVE